MIPVHDGEHMVSVSDDLNRSELIESIGYLLYYYLSRGQDIIFGVSLEELWSQSYVLFLTEGRAAVIHPPRTRLNPDS